jgi:hypothetical protein
LDGRGHQNPRGIRVYTENLESERVRGSSKHFSSSYKY